MAKKPGTNPKGEWVFFHVYYEDGSQRSNRRVPAALAIDPKDDKDALGYLIEVLRSDYIRLAELKGLRPRAVLFRHALPNAIVPALNVTALNLGFLIGGVVIVERVFSYPGFGTLLIDALQLRDIPLIKATVMISAAVYVAANLVADILAILFQPRLRAGP